MRNQHGREREKTKRQQPGWLTTTICTFFVRNETKNRSMKNELKTYKVDVFKAFWSEFDIQSRSLSSTYNFENKLFLIHKLIITKEKEFRFCIVN